MTPVSDPQRWWAMGNSVVTPCSATGVRTHRVFTRIEGRGPWMTFLHGFPTSSFDFAAVVDQLRSSRRTLCLDFVGFGDSDRPLDHVYSIEEQADAVETVWMEYGITETDLVAHDYGDSVAQELLWRRRNAAGGTRLRSLVLANGGIYPDLHRPQPSQLALLDPEQGAALSAAIDESVLATVLEPTFALGHTPSGSELHAMWQVLERDGGPRNLHLLIRYIDDRRRRERDWVDALETADVPLGFVWGMQDPISGAHIAERIVERFASATRRLLDDVGHWPPLEAPDQVVAVVREVAGA